VQGAGCRVQDRFPQLIRNKVEATHVTRISKIRLWISKDPNPKRKKENPKTNRNAFKYR